MPLIASVFYYRMQRGVFLHREQPWYSDMKALHSCLNFRAVPWIFLCVSIDNEPIAHSQREIHKQCSVSAHECLYFRKRSRAAVSINQEEALTVANQPTVLRLRSCPKETMEKKPLMCCANPATESQVLLHLNQGFAARADRLYLMIMRRASLPFLSRFHSRSELRTDARSWRLRFLSSPEIHEIAPYPLWRHARHGNSTHLRFVFCFILLA